MTGRGNDNLGAMRVVSADMRLHGSRQGRPIATRVAAATAAAGLVVGVLAACASSPADTPAAQAPAHASATPTRAAQPATTLNNLRVTAAAPRLSAGAADAGMPEYYVVPGTQTSGALQVRSSASGHVITTVTPSAACDPKTFKVAGAGNDRDFVVGCLTRQKIMFYRLQITSRGLAAAFTPLSIPAPGGFLNDIALTPDGSKLAIGVQGPGALEVVTLATGAVRTWPGWSPFDLSWADHGRELGFFVSGGLRVLDFNAAGTSTDAGRLVLPRTVGSDGVQEAMLGPDGTTIIASVTSDHLSLHLSRTSVVGGIIEISARTGKPERTLLAEHAQYSADGGGSEAGWYVTSCQLGAIDPTGNHLLASCDHFGRVDRGRFTALPGVADQTLYTAAW
jgi:hypothetical protein